MLGTPLSSSERTSVVNPVNGNPFGNITDVRMQAILNISSDPTVKCITRVPWLEGVACTQPTNAPLSRHEGTGPSHIEGQIASGHYGRDSIVVRSKLGPDAEAPQNTGMMHEATAGT